MWQEKLNFSFKTYLMYGHRALTSFSSTAKIYLNSQSIKIKLANFFRMSRKCM